MGACAHRACGDIQLQCLVVAHEEEVLLAMRMHQVAELPVLDGSALVCAPARSAPSVDQALASRRGLWLGRMFLRE